MVTNFLLRKQSTYYIFVLQKSIIGSLPLSHREQKLYLKLSSIKISLEGGLLWVSIKLIHFYKRCVAKTVVKPQHFLRANEGSHISPFLLRAEEGSLPRKQNKL